MKTAGDAVPNSRNAETAGRGANRQQTLSAISAYMRFHEIASKVFPNCVIFLNSGQSKPVQTIALRFLPLTDTLPQKISQFARAFGRRFRCIH